MENTGLDDIIQAVIKVTGTISMEPQRRYHVRSCDDYLTSVAYMLDVGGKAAAVMLRDHQSHYRLNCQYSLAVLGPHQSLFPALPWSLTGLSCLILSTLLTLNFITRVTVTMGIKLYCVEHQNYFDTYFKLAKN